MPPARTAPARIGRPRAARWYVRAAVVAVALAGGIAAVIATRSAASSRHAAAPRRPASRNVPDGAGGTALAAGQHGQLALISGSRLVNGMYTIFPRSRAGAVSAAVEFMTELDSTLQPDRAAAVARLAADPSYQSAAQDAAVGVAATRRALGLPASGPLPPGTAVLLVPVMYQVRDVTAAQLTVLLLADYTQIMPSVIRERLGVIAARLAWTPAGWRLLRPPGLDVAGLLATPGTAAAAAKGWEAIAHVL